MDLVVEDSEAVVEDLEEVVKEVMVEVVEAVVKTSSSLPRCRRTDRSTWSPKTRTVYIDLPPN